MVNPIRQPPAAVLNYAIIEGRGLVQMDVETLLKLAISASDHDRREVFVAEHAAKEGDPSPAFRDILARRLEAAQARSNESRLLREWLQHAR